MAMNRTATMLLMVFGVLAVASQMKTVSANDPDLTTDFGITASKGSDFTFFGFRNPKPAGTGVALPTFASAMQFPALTGLGLTAVLFEFGPWGQVNPHTHPRATELFYVLSGTIDVGFVDTNNTLFQTTLYTGDLFVFPKGLLHFQRNNQEKPGSGYSVLSSENPGLLQIAPALFTSSGTGLPDNVLAAAFQTSTQAVDAIKGTLSKSAAPSYG